MTSLPGIEGYWILTHSTLEVEAKIDVLLLLCLAKGHIGFSVEAEGRRVRRIYPG